MILISNQVRSYAYNAGFRSSALEAAVQIAQCESGFNTNAHNTSGEDSRGIWQINVSSSANPQYKNYDLFDPQVNANVAYQIYKAWGNNFGAWTCAKILGLVNPLDTIATVSTGTLAFVSIIALYLLSNK
jgi:hypothetical protein